MNRRIQFTGLKTTKYFNLKYFPETQNRPRMLSGVVFQLKTHRKK